MSKDGDKARLYGGKLSQTVSGGDEEAIELAESEVQRTTSTDAEDIVVEIPKRQKWDSRAEFLLTLMGYAIGIGNLWRFPFLVGKYGGGAFLIPYLFALIVIAGPLFLLEMALGQKNQISGPEAFRRVHPSLAGIGYAGVIAVTSINTYYVILLAWSLMYFFNSFTETFPWEDDEQSYFHDGVLHEPASVRSEGVMDLNWPVTGLLVLSWVVIYFSIFKGISGTGKVAYFTVIAPFFILAVLLIRALTLPGAGLAFYLTPRMETLLDPLVWSTAAGQIIFSLSPALGAAITLASYNPKDEDVFKDALIVATMNSTFSFVGGFVIFSVIGHMAWESGDAVEHLAQEGPALAFVVFPSALKLMPGKQLWAVLFFFMLFLLGLDSAFANVLTLIGATQDFLAAKNIQLPIWKVTLATCILCGLVSLLYSVRGGTFILDAVDHHVGTYSLLGIACAESVGLAVFYGSQQMVDDIKEMTGRELPRFFYYTWKYLTPFFSGLLFVSSLSSEFGQWYGNYPPGLVMFGWCVAGLSIGVMPFFAAKWYWRDSKRESQPSAAAMRR